ncbi:hypothetical protein GQ457_08G023750 [Hibiscus cannabinus]
MSYIWIKLGQTIVPYYYGLLNIIVVPRTVPFVSLRLGKSTQVPGVPCTSVEVLDWNTITFGHNTKRKRRLLAQLQGIDRALHVAHSNSLVLLERELKDELNSVLDQDELNTKFFHASTITRRKRNSILALRLDDDDDEWYSKPDELANDALTFYKKLFSSLGVTHAPYETRGNCGDCSPLDFTASTSDYGA